MWFLVGKWPFKQGAPRDKSVEGPYYIVCCQLTAQVIHNLNLKAFILDEIISTDVVL